MAGDAHAGLIGKTEQGWTSAGSVQGQGLTPICILRRPFWPSKL